MKFLDLSFWESAIRGLMALLCKLIYPLISWLYTLFMNVSKVNILSSDEIRPIYQRVTLILTIVMVFYVTFEFVKYIVQPDGITDKEKGMGKIIYRLILVVVLIAFVPQIFTWAFKLQTAIVDKGLIGAIIVGQQEKDPTKFGPNFSANIFSMFYSVKEENVDEECESVNCLTLVKMNLGTLANQGSLPYLTLGLNASKKVNTSVADEKAEMALIEFDGFLAVIVGGVIAYILAIYCVDVGVRWAQLVFLQIIAPIPIIGYLSPKKDGIFQKWCKQCLTTYLDLFIRTAIIYFVLLICSILLESRMGSGHLLDGIDADPLMEVFIYIALILGVLLFAKKAPELLKELFPKMSAASGNFGLKGGERIPAAAARALGAGLGAGVGVAKGAIARAHNRHMRNKANGAKSLLSKEGRDQWKQRRRNEVDALKKGAGVRGATKDVQAASKEKAIVDKQKAKIQKAREELTAAQKSGDSQRIARAKANLLQANNEYNEAKKARYEKTGINVAERNAGMKDKNAAAINRFKVAEEDLKRAEESGDEDRIQKAKNEFDAAKQNKEDVQKEIRENIQKDEASVNVEKREEAAKTAETQARTAYAEARENVAIGNNEKYRSSIASGAWGVVSGGISGAYHGAQATKIGDVYKKAKEGWDADTKRMQAVNKYYDEGGTGFIDRTVTQIEKSIGMDTAYTRTNLETKALESKIKDYDSTIAKADNVKKTFDATEDRLKAKLDDSKVKIADATTAKIKTGLSGDQAYAEVSTGESVAELSRKYKTKATTAKTLAEESIRQKEEQAKKHRELLAKDMTGMTDEQKAQHDKEKAESQAELTRLEAEAQKRAKESSDAEVAAKNVEKNAARYIMTQMLQDPNFYQREDLYDGVAIQELQNNYNEINLANKDNMLRSAVLKILDPEKQQAFIRGKFKDYDQLDDVLKAIMKAKGEISRQKQEIQDQKNRNEYSKRTQAQKAANDYNGSGK